MDLQNQTFQQMKLYQYPNCSTCRNAIKFLNARAQIFESIDITKTPPTKAELTGMLVVYEGNIRKLFNTSGLQYRELGLKDKLPGMSTTKAIELLAGNGKLIKRPFLIVAEGKGVVGFKAELWEGLIA